jgi:iron complex transport system ATP-binding protein
MAHNILEALDLGFSYAGEDVFKGLCFELRKGELLGLLGPNGAGKSTLFRCILGLDRRYTGRVLIRGGDIGAKKPADMARLAAYVPQKHYSPFDYPVMDMVLMGAAGGEWAMPGSRRQKAAEQALEKMDIVRLENRRFHELSGGEQQLVLIARALAQEAEILVMDEPAANLDYGNQIRLLRKIRELTRRGYSIFFSTHNPNHAFQFADRVMALHEGKIAALGPPEEVLTGELIERLYKIKVKLLSDAEGRLFCSPPSASDFEEISASVG